MNRDFFTPIDNPDPLPIYLEPGADPTGDINVVCLTENLTPFIPDDVAAGCDGKMVEHDQPTIWTKIT